MFQKGLGRKNSCSIDKKLHCLHLIANMLQEPVQGILLGQIAVKYANLAGSLERCTYVLQLLRIAADQRHLGALLNQ